MERRGSRREAKRVSFDDATLIKVFVRQVNLSCRTSRFALAT